MENKIPQNVIDAIADSIRRGRIYPRYGQPVAQPVMQPIAYKPEMPPIHDLPKLPKLPAERIGDETDKNTR